MSTQAERVAASRARVIAAGGRRIPTGVFSPEAARALEQLLTQEYAANMTACMEKALLDAAASNAR